MMYMYITVLSTCFRRRPSPSYERRKKIKIKGERQREEEEEVKEVMVRHYTCVLMCI